MLTAWAIVQEHVTLAISLARSRSVGSVMVIVWLVTMGGNLQAPVLSFFYQELAMSAGDIGASVLIVQVGVLISSPVYGRLLDKTSAFKAVALSLFMCTLGCFLRGCPIPGSQDASRR
jgi:MFS family permease